MSIQTDYTDCHKLARLWKSNYEQKEANVYSRRRECEICREEWGKEMSGLILLATWMDGKRFYQF